MPKIIRDTVSKIKKEKVISLEEKESVVFFKLLMKSHFVSFAFLRQSFGECSNLVKVFHFGTLSSRYYCEFASPRSSLGSPTGWHGDC